MAQSTRTLLPSEDLLSLLFGNCVLGFRSPTTAAAPAPAPMNTNEKVAPAVTESNRDGPIEATLIRIGVELLKRALAPAAVAMDRLISSEAHQFPQLALAYHENALHARSLIAKVFSNAMRDGQIRSMDASFLAEQFVYAIVDGPVRGIVLSGKIAKADKNLRERVTNAVGLLLDGCRECTARRS